MSLMSVPSLDLPLVSDPQRLNSLVDPDSLHTALMILSSKYGALELDQIVIMNDARDVVGYFNADKIKVLTFLFLFDVAHPLQDLVSNAHNDLVPHRLDNSQGF